MSTSAYEFLVSNGAPRVLTHTTGVLYRVEAENNCAPVPFWMSKGRAHTDEHNAHIAKAELENLFPCGRFRIVKETNTLRRELISMTPATDATNLTPSSLRAETNGNANLEGRNEVSALDGANNSARGTTPAAECTPAYTLARTREEELEACFLGIQRAKRDCVTYARGSEAYHRALTSLMNHQAFMLKACGGDFSILRAATAGTRAW